MSPETAKMILDTVREGRRVPFYQIHRALNVTGDLHDGRQTDKSGPGVDGTVRSPGVGEAVSSQDWRGRVRQSAIMVGASKT